MVEFQDELWTMLETDARMAGYWEALRNSGIPDDKGRQFLDKAWLCAIQERETPGFLREWRSEIDRSVKCFEEASALARDYPYLHPQPPNEPINPWDAEDKKIIFATSSQKVNWALDMACYLHTIAIEIFGRPMHDAVAVVTSVLSGVDIDTDNLKHAVALRRRKS
jgi:hypothetical protein